MSDHIFSGGCFCGSVRFEVAGDPIFVCHCHCDSCRRASGAPFVTWASFARDTFAVRAGAMVEYSLSPGVTRGHCAACGTSLTYAHELRADEIDVTLPSLDDASQLEPQAHIWVQDKPAWVHIGDELPQYRMTVSNG